MKIRNQTAVMAKRALLKYLCAIAVLILVSGCSDEGAKVVTKGEMWEWIGHHLHQGMSIDSAVAVLEKAGFVCQPARKEPTRIFNVRNERTDGVFDFVKCERQDGSPPVLRLWEVTLMRENGLLSLIGLRKADVYPQASK